MIPNMKAKEPLLLPQFLEEVLGVPKENHLKDMDKSILLKQ